jgi:hypothetical protein
MLTRRRSLRPLALACTTAVLAVTPTAASARPAGPDAPTPPGSTSIEPAPVVRQVETGGDDLAIVLSGAALIVAFAGAGIAASSQRRVHRLAGPQA